MSCRYELFHGTRSKERFQSSTAVNSTPQNPMIKLVADGEKEEVEKLEEDGDIQNGSDTS